ncbi:MAG: N-acetylmuramoyl-L-alanine amidase [Verrucomicrobiota bacterium]|nr:N-acetylmuramoyl-L-alanine amidase [Verrucomicrobiota bacterium]
MACLLASCETTSVTGLKNTSTTFDTVVVDAGHGGKDSGAYRRFGPPEKTATLDVAKRLARKLRESQLRVVTTRSSDVFIPLDTRVEMENREPNSVFVSIHFNDSGRTGVKGFETYYHSPYAAAMAVRIQKKLCTIPGSVNRGVHTANFRVLRNAKYPAVLVECGYLSNRAEGHEARSDGYRELLADRIAEAIVDQRYGSGTYRAPAAAPANSPAPTATPAVKPPGEGPLPTRRGPGLVPRKLGDGS